MIRGECCGKNKKLYNLLGDKANEIFEESDIETPKMDISENREKNPDGLGIRRHYAVKELDDSSFSFEENKTDKNKNLTHIIRYEYDIKIKRIVTKHIIYPDTKKNINKYPVTYGNNIKILNCILGQKYMSLDGIQKFIYDTTSNNNLLTSKGSFYSWNKEIYNLLLNTEYKHIVSVKLSIQEVSLGKYCLIMINNSSNGFTACFNSLFIFLVILCFIYYNHLYYNYYIKVDCEENLFYLQIEQKYCQKIKNDVLLI